MMEEETKQVAISCRSIIKSFGEGSNRVSILKGIDLDIFLGELFIIAGPSGSGKTTLLSMIAGLMHPDEGDILLVDHNLKTMSDKEVLAFRKKNVGFIFQSFHLFPYFNALENVMIPLTLQGVPEGQAAEKAYSMLLKLGMEKKAYTSVRVLSGGQQQRIAIARALIHDPHIIICDEPSSALDHVTAIRVMELLQELAQDPSRSIVVVTHDHRIFKYANRIGKINEGKITEIVLPGDEA